MIALSGPVAAQVAAEVKTRLRSPATLAAVLLVFAGSILWIPDPKGNASSLSWRFPDGREEAPLYSAAYVGFAATALACIAVTLVGYYLVAGSVRRDRERGVGAILAASPLSKAEYLLGKFVAHCAYLSVILGLGLLAGLTAWLRFGVGSFSTFAFVVPFLLLSIPAVAFTAALAVLFDVTPGLSGRGGYVIWFFVFAFVLVAFPMLLAGTDGNGVLKRWPVFDPAGEATLACLARQSVPGATGFSTGLEIRDTPFHRVPWNGITVTPKLLAARAGNLLLAAGPLLLAISLFDRFDPARRRRRERKASFAARLSKRLREGAIVDPAVSGVGAAAAAGAVSLPPSAPSPSALRAILAEARLIWDGASILKWTLLVSAVLAGVLPGKGAAAIFFLLLIPVVSEVAAREDLAGTRALVYSQPGVPKSAVLWKTASVALFLIVLGAPLAIRSFLASPERGLAVVAGILFVAGAAVGLGYLTSGGKLFSGTYLLLWYLALNNLPQADFTGVLGKVFVPSNGVYYLLAGALAVGAAMLRERLRAV